MTKPIRPNEVIKNIPDEVIEAFNELIAENWDGSSSTVKAKDVVASIASKLETERQRVYDNRWLDVEHIFRKAGWEVEYDQPSYGDNNFDAYFKFKKKKR